MKASFSMDVKPDFDTRMTLQMVDNGFLALRSKAIQRFVVYSAAQIMLEEVVSRIPTGADYASYRSSLRVVQSGVVNPVFAVAAEVSPVEEADGARDVLYFQPTNPRRRVDASLRLLMKYQPWTVDLLPFKPEPSVAKSTKRRVSAREVEGVRTKLKQTRPEWEAAFTAAGVKVAPPQKAEASNDLAYAALRLEYGLGGSRGVAHWRPGLAATKQRVQDLFKKDEAVGRAMLDWRFDGWKAWRQLSAPPVPATEIDSFAEFQDKIR